MRQLKAAICIFVILSLVSIFSAALEPTDEHFDKARELLNAGRYVEAAEEFKAAIQLASDGSKVKQNAKYWVGQCYFRAGRFDEALSIFEKIIEDYPESEIVPLTRVMMNRVRQEKENEKLRAKSDAVSDKKVIIDPKTGLKFTKILSDERLNLLISTLGMIISPDGRFLFDLWGHWVIPLKEGEEPFKLATGIVDELIFGSWSPKMSMFAFTSFSSGDLYVLPVSPETERATGPAKKLIGGIFGRDVRNYSKGACPTSWSPDGKSFAFVWWKNEDFNIWTIPATGGEPTQITDDPRWELRPVWSPDGKSIFFGRKRDLSQDGPWDIWAIPAKVPTPAPSPTPGPSGGGEGTAEKILDNAYLDGISPDGKLLTFHRDKVEGVGILRLSDKREFHIAPPKEVVGEFSSSPIFTWSPKGNKLLFYNSGFEYWSTLGVVLVYGGPSVELGKGVRLYAECQSWSPDGKAIIVTGEWETKDLWIIPTNGGIPVKLKVFARLTDAKGLRETEPKIWTYTLPLFSPDFKKLAFLTEERSLWVVPISIEERQTTGPAVKIAEKFNKWGVGWSPDSKRIAFSSTKSGNADIWIASVDGSELRRLTEAPEEENISGWSDRSALSPDGKMIVYKKAKALWMIPTSGGKPREIVKDAGEPVWSPDGKELGFIKRDNSFISIMTLATGEVRHVVDLRALDMVDPQNPSSECWGLTWSPDGKWLSFITMKNRASSHLWVVPAEGGEPIEVASDDPWKSWQYWSPDGRKLSYNFYRNIRVRMGAIWEVDVEEILNRGEREQGR